MILIQNIGEYIELDISKISLGIFENLLKSKYIDPIWKLRLTLYQSIIDNNSSQKEVMDNIWKLFEHSKTPYKEIEFQISLILKNQLFKERIKTLFNLE